MWVVVLSTYNFVGSPILLPVSTLPFCFTLYPRQTTGSYLRLLLIMVVVGKQREEDFGEPVLASLLASDRTPWYKKPNLRNLYFILFPACMGIEITSGFDSQIINTVQIVYTWNKCMSSFL